MTDDESRKAFELWENGDINEDGYGWARMAWEAAVEWATKRERERFIKQLIDAVDDKDLNTKISTRAIISLVIASNTQGELE